MTVPADHDLGFIAGSAVRYALGRATYAPSLVTGWLRTHWDKLPEGTRQTILRDVQEAIGDYERHLPGGDLEDAGENLRAWSSGRLGHECDRRTWYDFRDWMLAAADGGGEEIPFLCLWEYDDVHSAWDTGCGGKFQFVADGPAENEFRHCPYCGKPLST